jgi:hypothetical protein
MKKIASFAVFYFLLGALPVIGAVLAEYAEYDQWPGGPRFTAAATFALLGGINQLISFFDGKVQRHMDATDSTLEVPNERA